MVTLTLQVMVAVLALVFGSVTILLLNQLRSASDAQRTSWMLVGLAFFVGGITSVVQNSGSVWAFLSGPDSRVWAEAVRWAPVGNYGRTLLRVVMGLLLCATPYLASRPDTRIRSWALVLFLASLGAGALLGWLEGPLQRSVHYPNIALFETAEILALGTALLIGLTANTMDRILWLCLGVYTFRQVLNVISWSAFAWIGVPGMWTPSPSHIHFYGIAAYLVMIGLVGYRLVLARRGTRVGSLLEPVTGKSPSTLG